MSELPEKWESCGWCPTGRINPGYVQALEQRLAAATGALKTQPCARPSDQPVTDGYGYVTVLDCVTSGNCGCDCRAVVQPGNSGEKP